MHISPNKIWLSAKDYFFITFGIFLYAFGFSAFINPDRVIMGGMAGVGQIVYYTTLKLFGFGVPIAVAMYSGNLILLAIAYKTVGRTFVVRTIFGATVISAFVGILAPMFPEPIIANQKFMNVIIGYRVKKDQCVGRPGYAVHRFLHYQFVVSDLRCDRECSAWFY